jgi:hypothetical protein
MKMAPRGLTIIGVESNFFFFFRVLGFELRAYILRYSISPFLSRVFFTIESCELFAQAGFKQ